MILVSIPVFILLWPLILGLEIFSDVDTLERLYPLFSFYQTSLERNESFFWAPYGLSGFPVFASLNGFLSPLHYLFFKTFSFVAAYNFLIFVFSVLSAFLTALFLRKLEAPVWGAFIGGLIFIFSQWRMIHDPIIGVSVFLPLIFLLLWQMKKKIKLRFVLTGIFALGIGWLFGNWDYLVRILLAAAIFALYLGFLEKRYFRFLFILILMVLGSVLAALIQLIPSYLFIQFSVAKAGGLGHWQAVKEGLQIGDLAKLFLPYFDAPFLPLSLEWLYIGILPLFFFFYAFTLKSKKIIGFFSFLFLFFLLLSINHSPLFWLLHHLPIFNFIHFSFRWMMVGSFSIAVLVGLGIKKLSEENLSRRFLIRILKWLVIAAVSFSAAVSLVIYFVGDKMLAFLKQYFLKNIYPKTSGLPLEYYYDYLAGIFFQFKSLLYLSNPKVFVPIIFLTAGYFLLNRFFQGKIKKERFIRWIALFVALNFVLVFAFFGNYFPRKIFDEEPKTVKFLRTQEKGRILTFLGKTAEFRKVEVSYGGQIPAGELFKFKSEMLFPNVNFLYGLESAALYEPLMSKDMAKLLALAGADRVEKFESLADLNISLEEKAKILAERKNILDFLGVRYILSAYSLNEETFPKIFETKATSLGIPVYIFENKSARPLYYFSGQIDGNFEKIDFLGQEGIKLIGRENNSLVLETDSEGDKYLVFSQSNLPGWQGFIDGQETPIKTAGSVYMAVLVPPGKHKLEFRYSYWEIWRYFLDKYVFKK